MSVYRRGARDELGISAAGHPTYAEFKVVSGIG